MRHRLRVARAQVLGWIGVLRLAVAIARGKVREVSVGDSNAVYFGSDRFPQLGIGSTTEGVWVWHLGPRLMFSVATGKIKPGVRRAFRLLGRLSRNRDVVWTFNFGEIDVRCHLAERVKAGDQLEFVGPFVAQLQDFLRDLRVPFGVYVLPVPTAVERFDHEFFPVLGTNEERRATHGVLRKRVLEEIGALAVEPRLLALDLTDDFTGPDGWFRTELHIDGVHLSPAGREIAQARLATLVADR